MTRPQLATTNASQPRESRKVKTVCAMLEADESQVRRLVDEGKLEAHGLGKRGMRIYLDSVADYQAMKARQARRQAQPEPVEKARRRVHLAAAHAAAERLRARGLA